MAGDEEIEEKEKVMLKIKIFLWLRGLGQIVLCEHLHLHLHAEDTKIMGACLMFVCLIVYVCCLWCEPEPG